MDLSHKVESLRRELAESEPSLNDNYFAVDREMFTVPDSQRQRRAASSLSYAQQFLAIQSKCCASKNGCYAWELRSYC